MKTKILSLIFIVISCGTTGDESKWIQLFNGKDLSGWDIKITGYELNKNHNNTFRIEDGVLKVCYDQWDQFNGEFGHLFYKEKYSQYKLRVEYRFVGEQVPGGPSWAIKNSGVMLHSQSAKSMGKDQDFPVSIEAQFLGGYTDSERPTNNLCTPGTHVVMNGELITRHCTNSNSKTYYGEEWITVEMVVLGDSIIHHLVEGDTVLSYSKPQIGGGNLPKDYPIPEGTPLKDGYISLQAESHPIEFRKVELLDLNKKK